MGRQQCHRGAHSDEANNIASGDSSRLKGVFTLIRQSKLNTSYWSIRTLAQRSAISLVNYVADLG